MTEYTDIPTPQELLQQHKADLAPRVEAAVKRIVAELRRTPVYMGSISIDLQRGEYEIGEQLKRAFGSRGWHVEIHSDQRDGASIRLLPFTKDDR